MALVAFNNSPSSHSCFRRTITLLDWWLTKPESDADTDTIGVAGLTHHQSRATRCFSSAPILKIYNLFELQTVDGVSIILKGYINKDQTLQNGFSAEIFDHFIFGFPHNWKEFTTNCFKRESASERVTRVQNELKDSIEGHGDVHSKKQKCDSDRFIKVQVCEPSVEISQEHITEAGNKILGESSPMTTGFERDRRVEMSPIVTNTVDSPGGSKYFEIPSRRMTRSMKKMDNGKNLGFLLVNELSNLDKGTPNDSGMIKTLKKSKLRQKQFDHNVDVATPKDRIGILNEGTDKDGYDLTQNVFTRRTNTKGCRNKKKHRVDVKQKEDETNVKERIMTRSKFRSKLPVKRKLITSPKSAKSTSLTGNKGLEERNESENVLSLESFSGKRSRSGRIVLPPLEYWRNQVVVYDKDGEMCGIQDPK